MQMKTLLALLPAIAAAAPASSTTAVSKPFGIKVHVPNPINKECHDKYEGGYIASYHTGAGLGDATLTFDANYPKQAPAVLNGTTLELKLGSYNAPVNTVPGLEQTFGPVTISSASAPRSKYFINGTGIQLQGEEYAGWLVCDWWHYGVPQLFVLETAQSGWPKNCEKVELLPEYLN